jgi:hypothetical protein
MRRNILFTLILLMAGSAVFAGKVSPAIAGKVAIRFFADHQQPGHPARNDVRIAESCPVSFAGNITHYIINMQPSGFVVVSGSDDVLPILAYSLTGKYSESDAAPQFTAWLQQYAAQIDHAIKQQTKATPFITGLWHYYTAEEGSQVQPSAPSLRDATINGSRAAEVLPLITSNWNQNSPYNSACPPDGMGPGGHAYAGCVPVAMAQMMYYYRWPDTGTGSYSYDDPPYGNLSADFGNTQYNWNEMTNATTVNNPEIAKLLYHLGVSCDLQYGPNGSGMYNHKSAYSLRTFFRYSPQTAYLFRDSTSLDWDSILVAHLDRKMPMYYAGWSVPNSEGHAFVCDGYQLDTIMQQYFFHFNFGWGGSSNGYFFTNNLVVGGNNFNLAQEVIINAYPDTLNNAYPKFCEGNTSLNGLAGSFSDGGSPMKNYSADADCSWLIDPQTTEDSVTAITLKIEKFRSSPSDYLTVYDGATVLSPVLCRFAGCDTTAVLVSTGNKMLVTFKASGGPTDAGWFCTYATTSPVFCSGSTTITADTATLSNGSGTFNYNNNANCRWKLFSATNKPLTIHFRRFDTEPGKDVLTIYDYTTGDTLTKISGHFDGTLPDSVTAPGGKMFLHFTTNSSVTAKGWEIFYPMSHVGMAEEESLRNVRIYPNPASRIANIEMTLPVASNVTCILSGIGGNFIREWNYRVPSGTSTQQLDIPEAQPGVYVLQIKTAGTLATEKLIIQ